MLEDNASDVHALILLASASATLRDRAAALTRVQQALAVDPASATAHTMLGTLQLTGGDRRRARNAFVKATQLAPTSAEPWIALAQFHIAVGKLEPARWRFPRRLTAPPTPDAFSPRNKESGCDVTVFSTTTTRARAVMLTIACTKLCASRAGTDSIRVSPTPEPATLSLFTTSAIVAGAGVWRRRRAGRRTRCERPSRTTHSLARPRQGKMQ